MSLPRGSGSAIHSRCSGGVWGSAPLSNEKSGVATFRRKCSWDFPSGTAGAWGQSPYYKNRRIIE